MMKIESYSVCAPIRGLLKRDTIMGCEENRHAPLVILQRPKWIKSDADWGKIVSSIKLTLPLNTEIK